MPERLTPEQLQEIEARLEKATPGPWVSFRSRLTGNVDGARFGYVIERHGKATKEKPWAQYALSYARGDFSGIIKKADAEFMAAARQDIPALLAEIKALQQERDEARHTLATIRDDINICFVACERCGTEIDLKDLDLMIDILKVLPSA